MWPPPIGVISMTYARPFTAEHFPLFARMKAAGMDFCELLVPEPGELDPPRRRPRGTGCGAVPAAGGAGERAARPGLGRCGVARGWRGLSTPLRRCRRGMRRRDRRRAAVRHAAGVRRPPADADRRDARRRDRMKRVVDGLRAAGDHAAGSGVRFAVEPLNRFETDFCNTARQAVELCAAVDHPAIGVMLDTFHMNMEEYDLSAAIRLAAPHLIHFQANENHRGFLGTGHLDWPSICRALAEIGYAGAITLEPFRRTDHRLSVPLAQWRPPTHDEDADLAHSAALLRGVLHAARA